MVIDFLKFLWEVFEKHIMPFQVIRVFERGVILTLGKNPKLVQPGILFKFPLIQEVYTTPIMPDTISPPSIHITTSDNKTITVRASIEYEIEDAQKWLIEVTDAVTNLSDIVRGYVADYLTDLTWEEIIKKSTRTTIKNKINGKVQEQMGCKINILMFTEICQNKVILTQF